MRKHVPASFNVAWRSGWRYGAGACIVVAFDLGVQRVRHGFGWPRETTLWLNWVALSLPFVLVMIAAYRAGRASGDVKLGAWTGSFAGALPTTVVGLALAVAMIVAPSGKQPPIENLKTALSLLAMGPIIGGILGYFLAYIPSWIGRLVFRQHDPEHIAEREAHLSLSRAERRKRWITNNLLPIVTALGIMGLITLILVLPVFIATWVARYIPSWRTPLTLGAAALALMLLITFRQHHYIRIGTNWLALCLLSVGLQVGFIGTGANWVDAVTYWVIPGLSMWLLMENGVSAALAPVLRGLAQTRGNEQALPPVYFHDGGERLTYYPSRRKLALHALFAGGVSVLMLVLLFIPGISIFIQMGVVIFAAMALCFGFVPDVVRLLYRWPALLVTGEGVVDQGSLGIYGIGLIPWNQVEGVFSTRRNLRRGRFPEVHIVAANEDTLIAAQPFYKRPLLKLVSSYSFGIPISSIVLTQSPNQIVEEITAYIQRYAPAEYVKAFEEDGSEADD